MKELYFICEYTHYGLSLFLFSQDRSVISWVATYVAQRMSAVPKKVAKAKSIKIGHLNLEATFLFGNPEKE